MATTTVTTTVRAWPGVVVTGLGTFILVTAEQLPIGLLTVVSRSLEVSEGTAGLMVTAPSIAAAIAALLTPLVVRSLDRRAVLIGLMGIMLVASLLSAAAPTFPLLLAARILVGISIGGFWTVAAGLAVRLVPAAAVPRATAVIVGGVGAANVLGVPFGTLLGHLAGWRTAFAALAGAALLAMVALRATLPTLTPAEAIGPRQLAGQLRVPAVRASVTATLLLVTGHFTAFTYVSPALQSWAGFGANLIGPLLLAFGLAGLAGNALAGATVGRRLLTTMGVVVVTVATAAVLFPAVARGAAGGVLLLVLWGLAYGAASVSIQFWIIRAAPLAVEAATALSVAVFNVAIALGALLGGRVVDDRGLSSAFWLGGGLALLAGLAVLRARSGRLG